MTPQPTLEDLVVQVQALRAELDARRRTTRRFLFVLCLCGAAAFTGVGVAHAASGACPNSFPKCFLPNTPALASDINLDLTTLQDWIVQKVGPTGSANVTMGGKVASSGEVRIQTGATDNTSQAAGKPLFVTANIGPDNNGVEFRHDNMTQGLGFGYNTIYAAGSNASQPINLSPKGVSPVQVNGDLVVTANTWGSGPNVQATVGGRGAMVDSQVAQCPNGQYVCGIFFGPSYNLNWWMEPFGVECCGL